MIFSKDLVVSYFDDVSPDCLENLNATPKKIFSWITYTFNQMGYVPFVVEATPTRLMFSLRKINGNKVKLNFDIQIKLVMFCNYIFRVNQTAWPLRVYEDIMGGEYIQMYILNVTGKERSIYEAFSQVKKEAQQFEEEKNSEAEDNFV